MTHTCRTPISGMRRMYIARLAGRCAALLGCLWLYLRHPGTMQVLQGGRFFTQLSPLHALWVLWVGDMLQQLVPSRHMPLGAQKHLAARYVPAPALPDAAALSAYRRQENRAALRVALLWGALGCLIGLARYLDVLGDAHLFLLSVLFYVCDLICVLIWCPFRLLLGTRCCTTCRIFNWDHIMMFTPLVFVGGFFSLSLVALALAVLIQWEVLLHRHPQRLHQGANTALRCANCTDKLCTQYCPHK